MSSIILTPVDGGSRRADDGTSIVDAEGALVAQVGRTAGAASTEIDLLDSRDKRQAEHVDLLGDRRPDLYGPLVGGA